MFFMLCLNCVVITVKSQRNKLETNTLQTSDIFQIKNWEVKERKWETPSTSFKQKSTAFSFRNL
jgi:hypothetical protein